ncbi:hypothetical protein K3495_g14975 [Podosphaera aphanis]|nr:hypothetical protein K3495_g14975 [Podosphaera aphanis]
MVPKTRSSSAADLHGAYTNEHIDAQFAEVRADIVNIEKAMSSMEKNMESMMEGIDKILNSAPNPKSRHTSIAAASIPSIAYRDPFVSRSPKGKEPQAASPAPTMPGAFRLEDSLHKTQNSGDIPTPPANPFAQNPDPSAAQPLYNGSEISRLPNGDFDLEVPYRMPTAYSEQEKRVMAVWPEIVLPSQAGLYGVTSHKNKIFFKPDTKLVNADHLAITVLGEVQDQLKTALIPYHLWSNRLVSIMDGDFKQVAAWAKASNLSWLDLIEAIIQVLRKHRAIYSPMTRFSKLTPTPGKDDLTFAIQIRDAFYKLPIQHRASLAIKEAFKDKLEEHLPIVLLNLRENLDNLSTAAAIEEAIQVAKLLSRSQITTDSFRAQNSTAAIEDPRFADRLVNVAAEMDSQKINFVSKDDLCYKCGKPGHWASNCRQSQASDVPTKSTKYQQSTNNPRYLSQEKLKKGIRNFVSRYAKHKQTKRSNPYKNYKFNPVTKDRAYIVEDEEEKDAESPGPAEVLGKEEDDEELEQILAELMEEVISE